jgi:hypothetical protein
MLQGKQLVVIEVVHAALSGLTWPWNTSLSRYKQGGEMSPVAYSSLATTIRSTDTRLRNHFHAPGNGTLVAKLCLMADHMSLTVRVKP